MTEPTAEGRLIHALWHKWNFCGCGSPEDVLTLVRDTLRARHDHWASVDPKPLTCDTPHDWLLEYVLDAADLTEHGSSISGAWVTDEGNAVLTALESAPIEDLVDQWFAITMEPEDG